MTVAMMLPSLVAMLGRYRQALGGDSPGAGQRAPIGPLSALVGVGLGVMDIRAMAVVAAAITVETSHPPVSASRK